MPKKRSFFIYHKLEGLHSLTNSTLMEISPLYIAGLKFTLDIFISFKYCISLSSTMKYYNFLTDEALRSNSNTNKHILAHHVNRDQVIYSGFLREKEILGRTISYCFDKKNNVCILTTCMFFKWKPNCYCISPYTT